MRDSLSAANGRVVGSGARGRGSRAARSSGSARPSRCWAARRRSPMIRWQGSVVDAAGRARDLLEDDVLVEAGDHARRAARRGRRSSGSRWRAGDLLLPGDDLVEALDLHEPERGGELAHPHGRALDLVVGLAVVAVVTGEVDEIVGLRRPGCRPRRSRSFSSRKASRRRPRPRSPGRRPFQLAPWAWAQSSIRKMSLARQ